MRAARAVGLAIAGLAVSLPPALTHGSNGIAHGFKYVSEHREESSSGGIAGEGGGCGPEWVATGVGARITGTAGPGDDRYLVGFALPLGGISGQANPTHFGAQFGLLGAGPESTITVNAVCVKRRSPGTHQTTLADGFEVRAGGLLYVHAESTIPNGTVKTLEAGCGGGREVLGGASQAYVDAGHLNAAYPIDGADTNPARDDGWQGWHFNSGGGAPPIHVQAFCQRRKAPVVKRLRYVVGDPVTIAAPGGDSAVARCGGGRSVAGGGVFVSGAATQAPLVASQPVDLGDADHVPDDGWFGKALNETGADKQITAHAICGTS